MKRIIAFLLLLAMGLSAPRAFAADEGTKKKWQGSRFAKVNAATNQTLINVAQVSSWIYSDGRSAIQPDGNSGLYFPRGSLITTAIFQDGLVWGGKVNDGGDPVIRVGGQTFSIGTVPGAITSKGVAEDLNDRINVDRVWRVRKDYPTADLRQDAAELNLISSANVTQAQVEEVRQQYADDWRDWPAHKGAPFYDANNDGAYAPAFNADGTPKLFPDADEPGVAGADQVVWLVANDLRQSAVQSMYGSPSIGLEMQLTLWAYRRSDPLGNIIFKQFRLIYKGTATTPATATIDSMFVCAWADPDLGAAGDDFVGSDTTLSLGYVYNSVSQDGNYSQLNLPPPASGYDFFAGPLVPDASSEAIFGLKKRPGFRNLPMSSFAFFAAGQTDSDPTRGGDYNGTLQWWNLLRGFRPRPENPATPWIDPTTNQVTKFRVPGDPVKGTGWIDANPGDRRLLLNSGPFTMALGDTQEVVVAAMAALGSDRLSSISVLKFTDRFAQEAFDNLFDLPKPPQSPFLTATELDGQILLNWGENAAEVNKTEQLPNKGYDFQGYNVYQLPSAGAPIGQGIKLGTFDRVDEVTTIAQETFDQQSGLVLQLPVQIGRNSGIQRTVTLDRDRFREKPLINGQTYFFAVTAYNFNNTDGLTVKTLESSPSVVTVVPQTTKPGVRFRTIVGDTMTTKHESGISDGSVTPVVIDPSKTADASYEVTFSDTATWTLRNTTSGKVLLNGQRNQLGDSNYLITEGLQVIVAGPPLQGITHHDEGARWVTGGSHGGEIFFGGAFLGLNFNGSNLPAANYKNIRVEFFAKESFTDLNGNAQYDIGEPYQLPAGAGQLAYRYQGFALNAYLGNTQVPFRVFDTESNPPRQLEVVVRDRDRNGQWDLHKQYAADDPNFVNLNGGDIRFNYIFILDTDYDPTGARWNPTAGGTDFMSVHLTDGGPVQWVLWLDQRGTREPLGAAFLIDFTAPNVNTSADKFTFSSHGPTHDVALAKADLDLVNVFPNPYVGLNRAEANRFNRYVTFNHLPSKATIRIFTLAGVLVRTIMKDSEAQFAQWDLQNERGLPAASGVYVAHIDFPELNEVKVLKLAVVREDQFLRNF
ncbi:MAG: hypothetical protein AAB354_10665 [candidate division KSB1 bacterium]